jgi:hypothetical protein
MGKRVKIGQFNSVNILIINTPSFSSHPKTTLFAKPSFHCCPSLPGLHLGNDSLLQLCVHLGHLAGKDFITQRLVNVLHNFQTMVTTIGSIRIPELYQLRFHSLHRMQSFVSALLHDFNFI